MTNNLITLVYHTNYATTTTHAWTRSRTEKKSRFCAVSFRKTKKCGHTRHIFVYVHSYIDETTCIQYLRDVYSIPVGKSYLKSRLELLYSRCHSSTLLSCLNNKGFHHRKRSILRYILGTYAAKNKLGFTSKLK
jgi:hypothetical protein